jgi:hypothetical protein
VWVRIKFTGTHTVEYRGFAPSGKKHTIVGVNIYRIVNGKMAEAWIVEDTLDSLKQLGIIECTEKGKKLFPQEKIVFCMVYQIVVLPLWEKERN